jgi:hypothetical protein
MVSIYDIPEYIQILKKMLIVFMNKMTSYKIPLKLRKEFSNAKPLILLQEKFIFNVLLAKQNGENVVKEHLEFLYYHL